MGAARVFRPVLTQGDRGEASVVRGPRRALFAGAANAQIPLVRIGVLTDMSGPFADQVGPGSVAAAQMAAEDFAAEARGRRVEVLAADHQNRPNVGSAIVRRWADTENVAAIVDLPNSGVGLAVVEIMPKRKLTALASSTASSAVTGRFCAPTTVHWVNDTWAQGNAVGRAILKQGGDNWFFLTVDYALGQALERDATAIQDKLFGEVTIRADGRAVHAMHIFRVKHSEESRAPWDLYEQVDTIPAEQAFRPLADGDCRPVAR